MPSDTKKLGVPSEVVVASARSMIGTPYAKQGRVPRKRLDCVGLLVCVANATGLEDRFDFTNYGDYPNDRTLQKFLATKTRLIAVCDMRDGDIALFHCPGWAEPTHTAWLATHRDGYRTIIHAMALSPRSVTEHRLDETWSKMLVAVYRHPKVVN